MALFHPDEFPSAGSTPPKGETEAANNTRTFRELIHFIFNTVKDKETIDTADFIYLEDGSVVFVEYRDFGSQNNKYIITYSTFEGSEKFAEYAVDFDSSTYSLNFRGTRDLEYVEKRVIIRHTVRARNKAALEDMHKETRERNLKLAFRKYRETGGTIQDAIKILENEADLEEVAVELSSYMRDKDGNPCPPCYDEETGELKLAREGGVPQYYAKRKNGNKEGIVAFLQRVYSDWMEAEILSRKMLEDVDPQAATALSNKFRGRKELPKEVKIWKKSDLVDQAYEKTTEIFDEDEIVMAAAAIMNGRRGPQ